MDPEFYDKLNKKWLALEDWEKDILTEDRGNTTEREYFSQYSGLQERAHFLWARQQYHRAVDTGIFDHVVLISGDCYFSGGKILKGEWEVGRLRIPNDVDLEEVFRRVQ